MKNNNYYIDTEDTEKHRENLCETYVPMFLCGKI